jgi:hypothetical protein
VVRRWDTDERGCGVASASSSVGDLDRLDGADVKDATLDVEVVAAGASWRELREAALGLVGTFAESSTHVVERSGDDRGSVELLVTTGMLKGDGAFTPHGHVVRSAVRAA